MKLFYYMSIHKRINKLQKETQKYQNLSHWAYRFSSLVSAYRHDSLLLEIGKSIKLFNNLNYFQTFSYVIKRYFSSLVAGFVYKTYTM